MALLFNMLNNSAEMINYKESYIATLKKYISRGEIAIFLAQQLPEVTVFNFQKMSKICKIINFPKICIFGTSVTLFLPFRNKNHILPRYCKIQEKSQILHTSDFKNLPVSYFLLKLLKSFEAFQIILY